MSDVEKISEEDLKQDTKVPGAPGAVVVAEDPAAPSREVSSRRQSLSDLFTIVSPHRAISKYLALQLSVLRRFRPHQRWIPEQLNDHDKRGSKERVCQTIYLRREHASVKRTAGWRDYWPVSHRLDMRLPGPQSRNRHNDCYDCDWWYPGYSITRRHNQWHVLDDDYFTGDSWVWYGGRILLNSKN